MKTYLHTILVVALLIPSFVAAEQTKKNPIHVGVILPLSGKNASLGNYLKMGIELAYESLPSEEKDLLVLHIEDDKLNAPTSVSAYRKLRAEHNIQVAMVLGSGIGNAIAPIAEKEHVVLIAVGASDSTVSNGRTFAFTHWVIPEVEAETVVDEIKRRGYQRLAIVGTEQEGAIAVLNAFKNAMKQAGLANSIIYEENFPPEETDFRTFISKAKSKEVDGLVVLLFPGSIASFAKQTRSLSLSAPLIGFELFEDENEVKASDGALVGHWYVNADVASEWFTRKFKETYSQHPGWGAANAYDSLMLIANATQHAGADSKEIAHFLSTVKDYSGAAGLYSASGDNRFTLPAAIKVVDKDGFRRLEH